MDPIDVWLEKAKRRSANALLAASLGGLFLVGAIVVGIWPSGSAARSVSSGAVAPSRPKPYLQPRQDTPPVRTPPSSPTQPETNGETGANR